MEQVKRPEWLKVLFFLGISFLGSYVPERILFEAKEILYYSVYFYFGIFLAKSVAPALWEKLKKYSAWYQNLPKAGILRLIGTYSLEIYVLHCFITAANRIILFRLGIDNFYLNVTINLLMATFLPMLASVLLKKMKLYGFFFRPVTTVLMLCKNRTGLGERKKSTKNR